MKNVCKMFGIPMSSLEDVRLTARRAFLKQLHTVSTHYVQYLKQGGFLHGFIQIERQTKLF